MILYFTLDYSHVREELWQGRAGVPVMVVASNYLSKTAARALRERPVPEQCRPLFADSGGFHYHLRGVDYPFSRADYVYWGCALRPTYMATLDYPCEAAIAPDAATVRERQERTVQHALALLSRTVPWEWVPVLQGRTVEQYLECAALYRKHGAVQPYMGIGSLCARTDVREIRDILRALTAELPDTSFHLFGVKSQILRHKDALPESVRSSDTGAFGGLFGRGRTLWKEAQAEGLSQDQYEIWRALPTYQQRVAQAVAKPKQHVMAL